MTLDEATVNALAGRLERAERERKPVAKLTDEYPALDWDDAYAIQNTLRAHKIAAGVRIAGLKAGLTSKAKMKQMN
ncbi:MAG: 4-oxalocrotonate decarboxylase, partial [Alphaproteobacteria bacterium]|nr:4-oxalocrotonate decarboxylase [Alphaproteobacteria bacterium]